MLYNPPHENIFPNIQSKPLLGQLEAMSPYFIAGCLEEEMGPHLATTSFQADVESDKESVQILSANSEPKLQP